MSYALAAHRRCLGAVLGDPEGGVGEFGVSDLAV